VSPVWPKKLF